MADLRGLLLLGSLLAAGQLVGQPRADWPTYGHDPGGQRYSPLADITPDNVAQLEIAWTYHMRPQNDADCASDVDGARNSLRKGWAPRLASQSVRGLASDAADGRRTALSSRHPTRAWSRSTRRRVASSGRRRFRARGNLRCAASNTGPATARRRRDCSSVRAMAGSSRLDAATGAFAAAFGDNGVVQLATRGDPAGRRCALLRHDLAAARLRRPRDHGQRRAGVSAARRRGRRARVGCAHRRARSGRFIACRAPASASPTPGKATAPSGAPASTSGAS